MGEQSESPNRDQYDKLVEWARKLSKREIRKVLMRGSAGMHMVILEKELKLRGMQPHWTLTPGFWIACVIMILAAIAAWPVVREWYSNTHVHVQSAFVSVSKTEETPTPGPTPSIAASQPPTQASSSPVATPKPEQSP